MDWGTIAAIITALAAVVSAWVAYREYQDKENTGQPRSAQRSSTSTPTLEGITRKQFLKWSGLGGAGLLIALVNREIFKNLFKKQPLCISVAKPEDILLAEDATKPFEQSWWKVKFETVEVDETGEIDKRYPNQQAKFFRENLGNNVTLDMIAIPGSTFQMGSPKETPQREVTVQNFYMGRYPITNRQWNAVFDRQGQDDNLPVARVSWNNAKKFCTELSKKTGKQYRLPSEAEWEYACRAGTTTPFHFGKKITTCLANYRDNDPYSNEPQGVSREQTTPVDMFPPNPFGLHDMHGNVFEWCADCWHEDYRGDAPSDGSAWIDDNGNCDSHPIRGGSWSNGGADACRCASRWTEEADERLDNVGFRVACFLTG
ncbi:MAG: formylglycine-generating enzyme family protein [Pleurocapsa sp. MO_226.B13]|nr:formylglycine-generating enzyme family protein [Pleurocapsa sp. MO_226.B13]